MKRLLAFHAVEEDTPGFIRHMRMVQFLFNCYDAGQLDYESYLRQCRKLVIPAMDESVFSEAAPVNC